MKKTKIMHLISSLTMGGAETLITDYALKINKNMFDMVIVTISPKNNTINENKLKNNGIKVIYLGDKVAFPKATGIFKRIINKIHRYLLFYRIANEENPHIIHTHLGTNGYVIPISTKRKKIKLFHTIHSEVKANFKRISQRLSTRYCVKCKGMVPIALHSKMQHEANELFNTDSSLIVPNAIDINRFINVQVDKEDKLKSLNISSHAFVIGHVGRFVEPKNHQFLIEVFAEVKKKRSNAHLILVGIGVLENQVKEQVRQLGLQESVSFLGNRGDIPELMNIMDVFLLPSLYEGFPIVLIEAQAAGVKCVASDSISMDAFLTNLVTRLSLNDTIKTWADTIVTKKRSSNIIGDLGKHDMDSVIRQLEHIYN